MSGVINFRSLLIILVLGLCHAPYAYGYVGPAGIGSVGILLVVVAVLLIGFLGLILQPVRILLRRRRLKKEQAGQAKEPDSSTRS